MPVDQQHLLECFRYEIDLYWAGAMDKSVVDIALYSPAVHGSQVNSLSFVYDFMMFLAEPVQLFYLTLYQSRGRRMPSGAIYHKRQ